MPERRIGIKDGRKPGWYWAANEIIDVYGARMKPWGLAVYHAICRHANEQGECFASHGLLARETGMSVSSVKKYLKLLYKLGLIKIEVRRHAKAGPRSSLYTLLELPGGHSRQAPMLQAGDTHAHSRQAAMNNTNMNKTHRRTSTRASRTSKEKVLRDFGVRGSMATEIAEAHDMDWIRKAMAEMDKPEPGGVVFLHRDGWKPELTPEEVERRLSLLGAGEYIDESQ